MRQKRAGLNQDVSLVPLEETEKCMPRDSLFVMTKQGSLSPFSRGCETAFGVSCELARG